MSRRLVLRHDGGMPACLTVHLPDRAALVRTLSSGAQLRLGRDSQCDLCIDHPSVSRTHAHCIGDAAHWILRDLGSKNGSFVEGHRLPSGQAQTLTRSTWLRFGDVYCEFAVLDDAAAARAEADYQARRSAATAHTARLEGAQGLDALLDASLRGVLELAQCERGFVLLRSNLGFAVRSSIALDPTRLAQRAFSGSVGAVTRVLDTGASVVANEIAREDWLAARASVASAGLSALVCLPLHDGGQVLGAIYADRVHPGSPVTSLDLELLEAFAERAALWIVARRAQALLNQHASDAEPGSDWQRILAAHVRGK